MGLFGLGETQKAARLNIPQVADALNPYLVQTGQAGQLYDQGRSTALGSILDARRAGAAQTGIAGRIAQLGDAQLPDVAGAQIAEQRERALAGNMALAASSGRANPLAALRQATVANSGAQSDFARQAVTAQMQQALMQRQTQLQAQQAAAGVLGNVAQQGTALGSIGAQQQNAGAQLGQAGQATNLGAITNTATAKMGATAQAAGQDQAFWGSLIQSGGQLGASAAQLSDERQKEDIHDAAPALHKMLDELHAKQYRYKPGAPAPGGQHTGVMAQDLERSSVGRQYVEETPAGKAVEYGEMGPVLLAIATDLHGRLRQLEGGRHA